jgi:beta-galactosidase
MIAQGGDDGGVNTGHRGGAEIDGDAIGFAVGECGEKALSAGHGLKPFSVRTISPPREAVNVCVQALATASGFQYAATMRVWPLYTVLFLAAAGAAAQPPKMDTILYGASYYHEYMPSERLDKDIELMKKAGLTVVRLGESTWSSFEPRDGQFEFAWMDRILDKLHAAGIKVIFGTPTYSVPVWLYHKHPEILVTYLGGNKAQYGLRQNMDISHPAYRYYSERMIRKVIGHYASHPSIIGYQVDNETSYYDTAGESVQKNFVEYLRKKFGSVSELNRIWGLVYWGQLLGGWEEVPPRDGIINPGWKLEWERYQQSLTTDFLNWQAALVNESMNTSVPASSSLRISAAAFTRISTNGRLPGRWTSWPRIHTTACRTS